MVQREGKPPIEANAPMPADFTALGFTPTQNPPPPGEVAACKAGGGGAVQPEPHLDTHG